MLKGVLEGKMERQTSTSLPFLGFGNSIVRRQGGDVFHSRLCSCALAIIQGSLPACTVLHFRHQVLSSTQSIVSIVGPK